MINFRYHVVSIVAVFLALAVGIVMGTTVISESVVDRLEADARDFRARNGQLRQEADRLEAELGQYEQFGAAIVPPLIRDRLEGHPVAVLVEPGVPGALLDRTTDTLRTAGASPGGTIRLTEAWTLEDPAHREQLAAVLGADANPSDGPTLLSRGAEALGRRLGSDSDGGDDDLLRALDRAGFVKLDDLPAGALPGASTLIVYLSASAATAAPNDETFTIPLLDMLAERSATTPVVVAEPLDADESVVDRIRGIDELARAIATVDHATTWPGALSLVWALARGAGERVTHYGVRRGAAAIAPAVTPAPAASS